MQTNIRNTFVLACENMTFTNAMVFISPAAVLPLYLTYLGGTAFTVSIMVAIGFLFPMLLQPVFSALAVKTGANIKFYIKLLFIQRLGFIILILPLFIISKSYPQLSIYIFLFAWAYICSFAACYAPFYNAFTLRIMGQSKIGPFVGYISAFSNLVSFFSILFINGIIFKKVEEPLSYIICFIIGGILLVVNTSVFMLVKDNHKEREAVERPENKINYFGYFKNVPIILKDNRKFSFLVLIYTFIVISCQAANYYAIYSIKILHVPSSAVGGLLIVVAVASTASALIYGFTSSRLGLNIVFLIGTICACFSGFIVLIFPNMNAIYAAQALTCVCAVSYNVYSGIGIMSVSPKSELPIFVSVNAILIFGIGAICNILLGKIGDILGFKWLFVICLISGIIALTFVLFKIARDNGYISRLKGELIT